MFLIYNINLYKIFGNFYILVKLRTYLLTLRNMSKNLVGSTPKVYNIIFRQKKIYIKMWINCLKI